MDTITLIVDAQTLIDRIHGLKQWIYNGSVRIAVPASVLHEVERQYQASLKPKEVPKEPTAKRASGRATRREEHPLFDINPRTAWEFLERKRADTANLGVTFQKEGEEFAQWKEESVKHEEEPLPAPTSFADALLRKLNITDGPSPTVTKGPTKPKLVAKAIDSKSPWKQQQAPIIHSDRIPPQARPIFSYVLWRIYDAPRDPVRPIRNVILADGPRIKKIADSLGIPVLQWAEISHVMTEDTRARDHRSTQGQLERDFPRPSQHGQRAEASQETQPVNTDTQRGGNGESRAVMNDELAVDRSRDLTQEPASAPNGAGQISAIGSRDVASELDLTQKNIAEPVVATTRSLEKVAPAKPLQETVKSEGSDMDSDEEIIVFNPRAKRASGLRPRTPGGTSEPSHSRPTTANGPKSGAPASPQPARSPIKSTLKPQSPVFTPGQLYTPVASITEAVPTNATASPMNGQHSVMKAPNSPPTTPGEAAAGSSQHNSKSKQAPTDEARRHQSEIILQRQREAIQRQSSKQTPKSPPKKIQMEPTDHPIVIDPDDFDRSYILQTPTHTAERGGKRRGGGRSRPTSRGNTTSKGRKEPEEDFVLKSGPPRGSTRGKGKLFVP